MDNILLFDKTEQVKDFRETRAGFGAALLELGKKYSNVVALCADLTNSLKMDAFAKALPDRFFQVGIAEANMIGLAAGLATGGFVPFAGTFANFASGRVYDQIRQVVAYSKKNVKICASHAGITLGEDGATHQIIEDIGLMKMLPNMVVIHPCDYNQTYLATLAIYHHQQPVYLRFGRPKTPNFTSLNQNFIIGKSQELRQGNDVTICCNGHLVWQVLKASEMLETFNISCHILNIHTIKPLDEEAIIKSAMRTRKVVVAEEHMIAGGLCESIACLLAQKLPTKMLCVGINDSFGESGTPEQLLHKFQLNAESITKKIINFIKG